MIGIATDAAKKDIQIAEIEAIEGHNTVAAHHGIVFVTQTDVGGELIVHAVAIADKEAELPFLSGGIDELFAPAHAEAISRGRAQLAGKAKLELSQGVELVRVGSAIKRGNSTA